MSSVFVLQLKMQGSLLQQAERKEKPSTLIPDVDNAAVGNTLALIQEDTTKGILLFLFFEKGGNVIHRCGGLKGSALSLVIQRWEAVFRRERMPVSIDRTSMQRFAESLRLFLEASLMTAVS